MQEASSALEATGTQLGTSHHWLPSAKLSCLLADSVVRSTYKLSAVARSIPLASICPLDILVSEPPASKTAYQRLSPKRGKGLPDPLQTYISLFRLPCYKALILRASALHSSSAPHSSVLQVCALLTEAAFISSPLPVFAE